jgi:hypothetical protein
MSPFFFLISTAALYALVFNIEAVLTFIRRKARKLMPAFAHHSRKQAVRREKFNGR